MGLTVKQNDFVVEISEEASQTSAYGSAVKLDSEKSISSLFCDKACKLKSPV